MPSIQEMMQDLQTADAAGDTQLAQHIAGQIKAAQGGGQPQPQPAPQPAQPQRSHTAIAGFGDYGDVVNRLTSAGMEAGHQFFGLGDLQRAAGLWASAKLNGHPISWSDAQAQSAAMLHASEHTNPVSSLAGGAAGAVEAGMAGGAALKAAGVGVPAALELQPGQRLTNAGRLAVGGAAAGAAQGSVTAAGQSAAQGDSPATVAAKTAKGALGGAAAGAVLGPTAGVAAPAVAKFTANLGSKTALALAKVFKEDPADLQAAWNTFRQTTGRAPTMAELATLKQRGEIANAAKDSSVISTTLTQAADDAARARSANMQDFAQTQTPSPAPGPPAVQSSGAVQNATTATGDLDYAAARQHPFQIDTEESDALGGVSPADHLASQIVPLAGLKTADKVRIVEGLKTGHLAGEDAQLLRSKLAAAQGTGSSYSPAIASAREDLDEFLSAPGNEAASAALAKANQNYTAGAQRAAGAAHGESVTGAATADNFAAEAESKPNANGNFTAGMASGARSKLADTASTPRGAEGLAGRLATDDSLHAKLTTVFGQDTADALRRLGQAEDAAAANMNALAKRTPPSDDQDSKDVNTALRGLATVASHGVYKIYHGAKALAGLGMSPAVQEKVAQYLADPKMTQQGINLLRKAGATNAQLRDLALQAAQGSGALAGSAAGNLADQ